MPCFPLRFRVRVLALCLPAACVAACVCAVYCYVRARARACPRCSYSARTRVSAGAYFGVFARFFDVFRLCRVPVRTPLTCCVPARWRFVCCVTWAVLLRAGGPVGAVFTPACMCRPSELFIFSADACVCLLCCCACCCSGQGLHPRCVQVQQSYGEQGHERCGP